jgi:hypothetical protein
MVRIIIRYNFYKGSDLSLNRKQAGKKIKPVRVHHHTPHAGLTAAHINHKQ